MKNIKGHSPLPPNLYIDKSNIHGMGVFTSKSLSPNHDFGITHVADSRFKDGFIRTPLGGFINHSLKPNSEVYQVNDTFHTKTITKVNAGDEITVDYSPFYAPEVVAKYE